MTKSCDFCGESLPNEADVLAVMHTRFRLIPSRINYAIEQPNKCERLFHKECFDHMMHVAYEAEYGDDDDRDMPEYH